MIMSSSPSFLANKLAVVTGGSGTIGKAIAWALLKHGARVVLTGRSLERLESAAQDLCPPEESITCLPCDVTKEEDVVKLFSDIETKLGGCHLLVNNAGTAVAGATTELSAADFEKVMKVNVTGPFLCSREAMKYMVIRNQGGRIINIGSISSQSPRPDSAPYTTSKFAVAGLTQSLALDGRKHNIAVGMIHPGNVRSNLLSQEEMERREAAEGFIDAEDVAHCVATMASLPYSANVLEMTVIPTRQPLVGRG
jgi:NAD(P)-dependent dehydrogenase (short-subunit alcohol dehydrogenase family)